MIGIVKQYKWRDLWNIRGELRFAKRDEEKRITWKFPIKSLKSWKMKLNKYLAKWIEPTWFKTILKGESLN